MRIAVYPGSFDPITLGHEDIIQRASTMFDRVIVAVGKNSTKAPWLSLDKRLIIIKETCAKFPKVFVDEFSGLLVNYCNRVSAQFIVRGLRALTDFEYELSIAAANKTQMPHIETVFLPTNPNVSFVSSSIVRELHRHNGNLSMYVSSVVADALNEIK